MKILLSLLALVVIVLVYFLAVHPNGSGTSAMSTTTAETASSTTATTTTTTTKPKPVTHAVAVSTKPGSGTTVTIQPSAPGVPPVIIWSFLDRSNPRDTSALYTAVTLRADSNEYDFGTLSGICTTLADADVKQPGEISAIQCLNAGKGQEIGVFKQGSSYVIKSAQIVKGTQGNPDKYGTFTAIQTLK